MRYNFKNQSTGEIIEKNFPMAEVPSSFKDNGVKFTRDFISEYKSSGTPAIIIPAHMRA